MLTVKVFRVENGISVIMGYCSNINWYYNICMDNGDFVNDIYRGG